MEEENKQHEDPRYAPPYPQDFERFWPGHFIKAGVIVVIVVSLIAFLAYQYRIPTDPNYPPLPDDGMYIPGPEWYYLLFLQPFWYFTGDSVWMRPLGTALLPILIFALVVLTPLIMKKVTLKGILWRVAAFIPFIMIGSAIVFSGYQSKVIGCPSCHNPMMGVRQALPPMDVVKFYKVERQRQIDVGKYRASKVDSGDGGSVRGHVETYKDANWQLRHMYEPTFTW